MNSDAWWQLWVTRLRPKKRGKRGQLSAADVLFDGQARHEAAESHTCELESPRTLFSGRLLIWSCIKFEMRSRFQRRLKLRRGKVRSGSWHKNHSFPESKVERRYDGNFHKSLYSRALMCRRASVNHHLPRRIFPDD